MDNTFDIEALPVKISYVAQIPSIWDSSKKTKVDQWLVEFTNKNGYWSTNYYTGLGLRAKVNQFGSVIAKPVTPKKSDVLHSLFMDADAANYNFYDWCKEFGFDSDSIHALNSYKECLETAAAMSRFFDRETRRKINNIISEM